MLTKNLLKSMTAKLVRNQTRIEGQFIIGSDCKPEESMSFDE